MKIDGKEYLTTTEAAEELSITVTAVSQHCRRGILEGVKIGRSIMIERDEVLRYKVERRSPGRPKLANNG